MRFIILLALTPFISISQNNDVQKAQSLFSKGDYEKAVQIYEKLPSNKLPRFYSSYSYSLNALGKYKEARKVAQKMYLRDKKNLRYLSDVIIFERTGYNGLYHILGNLISPIDLQSEIYEFSRYVALAVPLLENK